ncbi:hypothetical protein DW657_11425 [Prevotella sp. AM23-5]|nr:hypothetical protein DW657_11425 [Prevotella sp. AM23-5]
MTGNTAKAIAKYYIFALVNQIIAIMSEILARIPKNLTSSPVLGEKKEWVLGAASLALGIGSSLFGANKAKKAARRAQAENQYRTNAEKAWYDKNYNTDYLDTKAGSNLLRRAQEVQDEYIRKADGAAAVGGGTAASVAQAKESANKAMGDTIANIAAQDTSRKQKVEDAHLANTQQLSRERQQIEQQKAQATSDAAQNASNAMFNFGVNQLGSELEGAKTQNSSKLANPTPTLDNKNVTDISNGLSHKADANGLLNPNASNNQLAGGTMLDEAVGNLNKKKPKVPHLGV